MRTPKIKNSTKKIWWSQGIWKKFNWCVREVSMVLRVFQGSFKKVPWKFQECFKKVSRMIQGILKGVSVGLNGIWKKFKGNFREDLNVFQESFKCVLSLKFYKDPSFCWGDIALFVTLYNLEVKILCIFILNHRQK